MTNNIANIPVVPAVPTPSTSSGSQAGNNTQNTAPDTTQGSSGGSQNVVQSQAGQHDTHASDANTSNNSNTGSANHFEKVLAAAKSSGQSSSSSAQNSTQGSAQPTGTQNANDNNSSNDNSLISQAVLVVASQLLSVGTDASASTDATSTTSGGTQTSQADALQQLQQILQQLLQQATALEQGGNVTNTVDATSSGDATADQSNSNNNSKTAGDNPLADAISQLLAMVNQLQQTIQQPTGTSADAGTETSAVTSQIQNISNVLQQLSDALTSGMGTTADATANTNTNTDLANAVSSVASAFDQLLQDFQKATGNGKFSISQPDSSITTTTDTAMTGTFADAVNALQSALSHVSDIITKQDGTDSGNSTSSNKDANDLSATTQVPAGMVNTAQQPVNTDTVKFVASTQQTQAQSPVDQVSVQIKNAADTGKSQINIQLEPADLGKVQVQMVTGADGKTGVTITADNRQTLVMLQSEARSLETALRNIGIRTDAGGLNFNLSGQGQNTANSGNQGGYTKVAREDDDSDLVGAVSTSYQLSVQSGLDIRV